MPTFSYSAKTDPDTTIEGDIEAVSEQDAVTKLARIGYFPFFLQARDVVLQKEGFAYFPKVSRKEIVLFTRQLASLIESGVNIMSGLNIVRDQTPNKYLKFVLSDVIKKIKDGKPLSESFSSYPKLFGSLYVAMVRSGEAGGTIETSLRRLSDFLEKEEDFKNSVSSALTYPIFILFVSILTVIILLGFVIPRLVAMFKDMGQALPLPTQILVKLSEFLQGSWWPILLVIASCIFVFHRFYKSPAGKLFVDRLKLKSAILGKIILESEISRLMRTLSLLLSSGLPIIQSLDISKSVLTNDLLSSDLGKFREGISGGASLSDCLKSSVYFSGYVTNIVAIGEETGAVEKSLLRVADEYEKEVDRYLHTMIQLLEPAIILLMGCVVGFIVISMLLPIFQINLLVK